MILNYIVENDEINITNKSLKIINIYNLRFFEDTNWYNILFTKISEEVEKLLKVIYDCNIKFNIAYMTILKESGLLDTFYIIEKELKTKTLIKYFFDNNMIYEEFLIDLSKESDIYNNKNFAVILDYHIINEELSLRKKDKNKITNYKIKNSIHNNIKYYLLRIKYNENIFYTQELVKFNNKWWLITTKWNKYYYKYKEVKIILWIFSELI